MLWAFEGITSYYDDLSLVRCGLIDEKRYLGLLAETVSGVERGAGRLKQTLEQSSFEAWTKYYRQDENSPNSIVSYYTKGALAALALDLTIRRDSQGRQSLDDVMRALWRKWLDDGKGLAEDEWESQAQAATGLDLTAFFDHALRSVKPLPLAELLATQGVELRFEPAANAGDRGDLALSGKPAPASLGVKAVAEAQGVRVLNVYDGGAAQRAGVSGGDVIVAIDKLKAVDLDKVLARYQPGDKLKLHLFRRDELLSLQLELQAAPATPAACWCRTAAPSGCATDIHRGVAAARRRPPPAKTGAAGIEGDLGMVQQPQVKYREDYAAPLSDRPRRSELRYRRRRHPRACAAGGDPQRQGHAPG